MIAVNDIPSNEELTRRLEYKDGLLYWTGTARYGREVAGRAAGYLQKSCGYIVVMLNGKNYRAHRLIFAMHHGYCPEYIDHINGDRADNRIENLRECTQSQNSMNTRRRPNNTSGCPGVHWFKPAHLWQVYIEVGKKRTSLGYFHAYLDACAARKAAENRVFGEFKRQLN